MAAIAKTNAATSIMHPPFTAYFVKIKQLDRSIIVNIFTESKPK